MGAANVQLFDLPDLLLVEDALKVHRATVWTSASLFILVQPFGETEVAEMLTAAYSEASIPQDLGTDATVVLLRNFVDELVAVSSTRLARPVCAAASHWRKATRCTYYSYTISKNLPFLGCRAAGTG